MKRKHHLSEKSASSKSNSQISDEDEPIPKRPRLFIPSPTSPIDTDNQIAEDEEDEIIIDEPQLPSMIISEDNQNELDSDDDDIIEVEQENLHRRIQQTDDAIIVVSDSDSSDDNDDDDDSDDQGIDVTDDILLSVSSNMNPSIYSSDIEDIEVIQEEFVLNNEDNEQRSNDANDDDRESLEIITYNNQHHNNELIDLTEDEIISISYSPVESERKLSIDAQQCPICLETLSHLQGSGVYLTITRCRHVMCTLCSRQLLATSSRCPLCRENLNATTIMPYCILT